ncbi:probable cytochrome P450 4aa1 isoform X2 [Venturia canescens]|uniref:probable cytochrome P450 4aa1 isoform X2 n=1 Tax=Venturia canescens TaxID=32260 RepID=UPI001C9CF261|nr:probable cytochrome P450 4aa1 isoform X2 [Venturia canescens]
MFHEWIFLLVISIFGIYLLYNLRDRLKILRFILSLDGPPAIPILGNAAFVYDEDVLRKMSHDAYELYGPVFRIWLTLLPCVVLLEPKDIQQVLGNSKNTGKIMFYKMLDNFLGKGLITSNVETWTKHRKILQPAFHRQNLEKFVESFTRCSERLANKISPLGQRDINVTSFVNDSVYEILNETVLGVRIGKENGITNTEELPFRKGKVLVPYRLMKPWLLIDWIYRFTRSGKNEEKHRNDLANACRKIVMEKREKMGRGGGKFGEDTLMDFMMEKSEASGCLTDEEIVNECCTFMLAGQDSVGTATAITLFLLANNSVWLDKCVNEIDHIFGKLPDESSSPKIEDFREMKYLDWCIKETLRLYPSVPLFARTLGEDLTIGKHVLPAGCGVIIMPYSTHRLAHHFSDPHAFKPERFNPENSANRHPYAYVPFSAGPRNCIGNKFAILEIKSMISMLLRKFVLAPVPGKDQIQPKFRLTVRAKGGLWIRITPRNDRTAGARTND